MWLEARLRAFAAVGRHGSFSRAAEELLVSQPAVSKHVALLETQLGVPLVARRPTVHLTPPGRFLSDYLNRAEALLEEAQRGVRAIAAGEVGALRIGASGTPGTYLLPPVVARYLEDYPGVELDLRLGTSGEIVGAVRAHELDFGIVGGLAAASELDAETIVEDEIVLVGAPELRGERLRPHELEELVWVHREEGSATRVALDASLEALGISPKRRISLPSWEAIKLLVALGGAVAACSRLAVEVELRAQTLRLLDVRGWRLGRPIVLVRNRDIPLPPPAEAFVASLRRNLSTRRLGAKRP